MNVSSVDPRDRMTGLGEDGFAVNVVFTCGCCGTKAAFGLAALEERHIQTSSSRDVFFSLEGDERETFNQVIGRHVKGLFDRFVSDFKCSSCKAPTVIMWRWEEGAEGGSRYEPLTVLEPETWPAG